MSPNLRRAPGFQARRSDSRFSLAATALLALALAGCSRGEGLQEFATNLRDRVAGDAAEAEARRVLRPSPAETGGGGPVRPRPQQAGVGKPGEPGQPGQTGDQGDQGGAASGPGQTQAPPPPPPMVVYYDPTPPPAPSK